ncbi:helix-turn-helix domain-containing protein [Paenibacillus sp. JCM 10914]
MYTSRITQEQLATRLGVSYQAVSKWENGQSLVMQ